jgi:hypothetical protein
MKKLLTTALRAVYSYPFIPGMVLTILLLLFVSSPVCEALELSEDAHTYLTGPVGELEERNPVWTIHGFHREALAKATHLILKKDGSRMSYEDMRTTALFVIDAADDEGIDPFVALAVVFQESRFKSVKGDGGAACGIAQQHPKFSIYFPTAPDRSREKECERLMHPEYAAKVLAHHLTRIQNSSMNLRQDVYRYNSAWHKRGRHWWHTHFKWRCLIEQAYDREVHQQSLDARLASDIKGSYKWWRQELAAMKTSKGDTRVD